MSFQLSNDKNTSKKCIDALNKSFNSIQNMIDNYSPEVTYQDYSVLYYSGVLTENYNTGLKPRFSSRIFGVNNFSTSYEYVGLLDTDGILKPVKSFDYGVYIYQFIPTEISEDNSKKQFPDENNNLLPIYVGKQETDKPRQAEEINGIIQNMSNEYFDKTTQRRETQSIPYQIILKISAFARDVIDYCFLNRNTISFVFNTSGISAGETWPIFSIKRGTSNGEIQFLGLDSLGDFTDILNNYGYFTYTYNTLANEQQISFRAYEDCPNKIWRVFMNFNYTIR